jgi:hypothetical protein
MRATAQEVEKPIVDGAALSRRPQIGALDRPCTTLQLQRSRHAVERLQSLFRNLLPMTMEVNKARTNHLTTDVQQCSTGERLGGYCRDPGAGDANVPAAVQPRGGINHPASTQDNVVLSHWIADQHHPH